MADQVDEDLQMALQMSMQTSPPPPEPKRSKPRENAAVGCGIPVTSMEESPEDKGRRTQRELMAAAAEKRMMAAAKTAVPVAKAVVALPAAESVALPMAKDQVGGDGGGDGGSSSAKPVDSKVESSVVVEIELSLDEANQLFSMVFGNTTSKQILGQWTNQGIRFSADPETLIGLVQLEGGPCGAFVLKYLIFKREGLTDTGAKREQVDPRNLSNNEVLPDISVSFTEEARKRALVRSMGEILFRCGSNKKAVVANLNFLDQNVVGSPGGSEDELIAKTLEGLSFESGSDLQKELRITTYNSYKDVVQRLEGMIPIFESRMGAMLFLVSALLSRGLDAIQADRDDPSVPLVTAPFGHASQEIVNLLLCGQAVANVFDERIDLGGGMFLNGIPTNVQVGFLTLLESLNFCKVGQNLKHPKWPIWVVGSESHYTVLFALEPNVQDENEIEERETKIRRAFDAQDQSGGGGFISVEGFHQVLRETNINLPAEKVDQLCGTGFIVWSEFWQVLLDLDQSSGGLKDSSGLMGKKVFDLYHFNGIAKSVSNGNQEGETPAQRPRLTKLKVSVPPRWTPEEYMADVSIPLNSFGDQTNGKDTADSAKPKPPQHAPLVDCIRTRWPRAICNWIGDPPSIV
ncbi:hypothetical protein V2J09_008761 [Rumex salicifolius]